MPAFVFPTAAEIREIEQESIPKLEAGRIGLELFPIVTQDADEIIWEQLDNFTGLQNVRGLNGNPSRVSKTGAKSYSMKPGYYGEFEEIDETELTRRRQLGTFGTPTDIGDLTTRADLKLINRELDRIESIIWTLLTSGTFAISGPDGILHTDTFAISTDTPSPAWSTTSTSTPVADLRRIKLLQRSRSSNFGAAATLYMNAKKVAQLMSNANASDLGKYTQGGGDKLVSLDDFNRILVAQDLPKIVEYDAGYLNDSGTFVPFIADDKAVLIAPRTTGEPVGEYIMTRNANNPDLAPGRYVKIIDRGEDTVPRKIEVHRGHNGGPAIYYPGSIVAITC